MALETLKNSFALFYDSKQHVGMVFLPLHFETRSVSLFGALNSEVAFGASVAPSGITEAVHVGRYFALFTSDVISIEANANTEELDSSHRESPLHRTTREAQREENLSQLVSSSISSFSILKLEEFP